MILILGAGGHGQVVADIFRAARAHGTATAHTALLDDDVALHGATLAGSEVLGGLGQLKYLAHFGLIVAIGDNARRARLFATLEAQGERFASARHPRSIVADGVRIGDGTAVCAAAVINTGSAIGRNTIVNTAATIDHHCTIGDHVHIAPGVHMGGEVRVGEGALVGIGAVVLPRVVVGAWSTVGAGAVVTSDVPPGVTVVGIPAHATRREGVGGR
jgi:sugar O-acyltransferase (sialic acid O-acetyltransferase NeuD family)